MKRKKKEVVRVRVVEVAVVTSRATAKLGKVTKEIDIK
jgi:hypothetical protein